MIAPGAARDGTAPVDDTATNVAGAVEGLTSPEARAHAEGILRRFSAIVESTDDAVISKTPDGIITSWNAAAERMFGYGADEVVGHSIQIVIPPECADEEPLILARIRDGGRIEQFETVRMRKDGSRFPASITASPIWGAENTDLGARAIIGVSKIVRDITVRKAAEATAQREQGFANSLIEAMPGIFYLYDRAGRFLRWNANFERVSGYSGDEIATMHPREFFVPADRPMIERRVEKAFETGASTAEAVFLARDGTTTPYFFTGRSVEFDGAMCLVGVGMDVSERREAEAALVSGEERFRSTLDKILEGCQMLDFEWRYLYLNDAAAIQNRRPNSELLGNRMPDEWPGIEATPIFALLRDSMERRVARHSEIEFTFGDGSSSWFDVRVQPVPEGIFVLSIDVTERVAAERALRETNEGLEQTVAHRTIELEAARERAEAADRTKSAFLATMSHELRTPLNSIIGFTGIIRQGLAGPVNEEQVKQLGMVQSSARHLLDLINDVLDISKIEAGELEIRHASFDLFASLDTVVASLAPLAAKKGLSLRKVVAGEPVVLVSDQRRVEQILLNLVNNGIKFTRGGGVTITADVVIADGADRVARPMVRLAVSDTGIGIRREDMGQLFQPFRQIDSGLQREHEGSGLGLAISRRLSMMLGGAISVASVPGEGTVFTVLLPLAADEA